MPEEDLSKWTETNFDEGKVNHGIVSYLWLYLKGKWET
jgi:hypothetical protein